MPELYTEGKPSIPSLAAKTFYGKEITVAINATLSSPDSAFFHRFTVSSSFLSSLNGTVSRVQEPLPPQFQEEQKRMDLQDRFLVP